MDLFKLLRYDGTPPADRWWAVLDLGTEGALDETSVEVERGDFGRSLGREVDTVEASLLGAECRVEPAESLVWGLRCVGRRWFREDGGDWVCN